MANLHLWFTTVLFPLSTGFRPFSRPYESRDTTVNPILGTNGKHILNKLNFAHIIYDIAMNQIIIYHNNNGFIQYIENH